MTVFHSLLSKLLIVMETVTQDMRCHLGYHDWRGDLWSKEHPYLCCRHCAALELMFLYGSPPRKHDKNAVLKLMRHKRACEAVV